MKFKCFLAICLAYSLSLFLPCTAITSEECIQRNNDAVKEINSKNFPKAIGLLEQAIAEDPDYKLAAENLATADFYFGKQLASRGIHAEALKHLHRSLFYLTDRNALISRNSVEDALNSVITKLGKNPTSFDDRVSLGDDARKSSDWIGALVEYKHALSIRNDSAVKEKLSFALQKLSQVKEVYSGH
ncbi:hypothetical protein BH11CYA1_BH11CYA1_48580 [soil metagenome]